MNTENEAKVRLVHYHTNEGRRVAIIAGTGRKWCRIIEMDSAGIRVRRVPKSEERYMRTIDGYELKRAARRYLRAGKSYGITGSARATLRGML